MNDPAFVFIEATHKSGATTVDFFSEEITRFDVEVAGKSSNHFIGRIDSASRAQLPEVGLSDNSPCAIHHVTVSGAFAVEQVV